MRAQKRKQSFMNLHFYVGLSLQNVKTRNKVEHEFNKTRKFDAMITTSNGILFPNGFQLQFKR